MLSRYTATFAVVGSVAWMAFANCCFSVESNASTVRSVRLKGMVSTGMVVAVLIGAASGAGACSWHEALN